MVQYPSGVAKGQGGPVTCAKASSTLRNNLRSALPTSTPPLTLTLPGSFYDPITRRYTLSGAGVTLRFKLLYKYSIRFLLIYAPAILCNLFVLCIFKGLLFLDVFFFFLSHLQGAIKVSSLIFLSTVICPTGIDTSKQKSADLSFIKAFWQLSLQRNHIFPRELASVGPNCHSRTMLDHNCLTGWVSGRRGACNFNRFVIFH